MSIVQIALPVPMRQLFDYESAPIPEGCRVSVTFGNRELLGIVVGSKVSSELDSTRIKPINARLDDKPVLDEHMLSLGKWLAGYLHHPIGDTLLAMLPSQLRRLEPVPAFTEGYYQITKRGAEQLSQSMRGKKQQALLSMLSVDPGNSEDVKRLFSRAVIQACLKQDWIREMEYEFELDTCWGKNIVLSDIPKPTTEQAIAISSITTQLGRFAPFLLEGVTGSGKTEVYLQAIQPVLANGQQVLVLVPEIGLTPQTVSRFEKRFGITVGVLHSGLTDKQRLSVWQRAKAGNIGLVIGTRSAVFTPFLSLGMIIVDEEHDESYKQQDGPRYHARDVAVMRAQKASIPLILGSATPSLESLNNALHKKYQLLQLQQRTGNASLATQQVMDIRQQSLEYGVAQPMLAKMKDHLDNGGQVLVFINRRGFSPSLVCHDCGYVDVCNRCDAPYTVHKSVNRLHCHRCDYVKPIPRYCSNCNSQQLISQGVGTEQLEQGLEHLFPTFSTVRVDSDSVRGKDKLANIIDAINRNEHQILIGTQILSKGHHFPLVTLVVILDVDGALFSADLRATERLAQLITQLSGRAGREARQGEMWLQTHHPSHPLLQDLLHNGYGHFARYALSERRAANAPPFVQQAIIRAEASDADLVYDFLCDTRQLMLSTADIEVVGPIPAIHYKRAGRFRMLLLIQANTRRILHTSIANQLASIESLRTAKKVRWSIDISPNDMT